MKVALVWSLQVTDQIGLPLGKLRLIPVLCHYNLGELIGEVARREVGSGCYLY